MILLVSSRKNPFAKENVKPCKPLEQTIVARRGVRGVLALICGPPYSRAALGTAATSAGVGLQERLIGLHLLVPTWRFGLVARFVHNVLRLNFLNQTYLFILIWPTTLLRHGPYPGN